MTQPHPKLLPPLSESSLLQAELERYSALLLEMLAYGTQLLAKLIDAGETITDMELGNAHAITTLHLRWCLELLGGFEAQVRQGWIEPASVTLRSLFEATIGLEYLVSDPSMTQKRARAYLFMIHRRRLDFVEAINPQTKRGKQFRAKLKKDRLLGEHELSPPSGPLLAERRRLFDTLASQEFAESLADYQSMVERKPDWYWFHGGPRSLEQLADKMGRSGEYEFFYRQWSGRAHGQDVVSGKLRSESDGTVGFYQLRLPRDVHPLVTHAGMLAFSAYGAVTRSFVAAEQPSFGLWYVSIRKEFLREGRVTVRG